MAADRVGSIVYWSAAVVLLLFGAVAIFSVGAPFFLTGIAMVAVGPRRHDPAILWPVLLGVWAFVLGYVALAPMSCSSSATAVVPGTQGPLEGPTICSYVFGSIRYAGGQPSPLPAFLAGLVAGVFVAFASRRALGARRA